MINLKEKEVMKENSMEKSESEFIISIDNLNKWFDDFHVLIDVNLKVAAGEKIVICGPSGSGKSTLIRCINRLEKHQKGRIDVMGHELSERTRDVSAIRREVGMVFQSFNLFPHLTILQNLTLAPIWLRKFSQKDADRLAWKYLKRVNIAEHAHKFPSQLSGGAAAEGRYSKESLYGAPDYAF